MLDNFKKYYDKAKLNQQRLYEGYNWTKEDIDDDLIWYVPIYDVVNRRYAAFSSFTEAVYRKEQDPKGNGNYFKNNTIPKDINFATLCYLFRLCGSGINYKPKTGSEPWGTHGFGNFWIVDCVKRGLYRRDSWIHNLPKSLFCDVKGYLLPMIKGGMYDYIKQGDAYKLVDHLWKYVNANKQVEIFEIVNVGNEYLIKNGFKRQNFVLCAFAMDMAEYFPSLVSRDSRVLVGSNARKCLKLIFPTWRGIGSNLDTTNKALVELCNISENYSKPYDMEDVACDFIRYKNNFQSKHHIELNNGKKYYNNVFK